MSNNGGSSVKFGNLIRSEAQRVFKRKRTWAALFAYLLFVLLECGFLAMGGTSFYDAAHSVKLDSLNTSPFLLRELAILMNFILIPMLAADSFGSDVSSGALRLALIRPVSRAKLFAVKWLVLILTIGALTLATWAIGTAFGLIFMPRVEETTLIGGGTVGLSGALLFGLAFYGAALCVFAALLGIGGLVARLLPNPVLAYIGVLAVIIGGIYVSDQLTFLLTVSDSVFGWLGGRDASLGRIVCAMLAVCAIMGTWSWNRREWTQ